MVGLSDLAVEADELFAVDVTQLTLPEFVEHMAALERFDNQYQAMRLDRLAAFDRSAAWQIDAAATTANWLKTQTGMSRAVAGSRVNLAKRLVQLPETRASLSEGRITEGHARVMARVAANPRVRDALDAAELDLVLAAENCDADAFASIVDGWIDLMDQDGAEPPTPEHDTVRANRVGDRVKIDVDLGLETGLPVLAALNEREDALFRQDKKVAEANPEDGLSMRTPGNRRAEAMVGLILDGAGAEANPRRREPLFLVHVDEETYLSGRRHPDTLLETDDGSVVPIDILKRWRCGSRSQPLIADAARAVLYLGREVRYANREQRRALAARDRGCAVPGCERPPEHCDAHHVQFWDEFGLTDIDNLVLMCRHHHRMVHAGALDVMTIDGHPLFTDRYGRVLEERRHGPPDVSAA